jgi:hypothetical protein
METPESEPQKNIEQSVVPGEELHPFDRFEIRKSVVDGREIHTYHSRVLVTDIDSELFDKLPFQINTLNSRQYRGDAIVPFKPKEGYQVTRDDFQTESRLRKYEQMRDFYKEFIDFSEAPIYLEVIIFKSRLTELGLIEGNFPYREIKPQTLSELNRMRLHVFFPQSEAGIDREDPKFYPVSAYEGRPSQLSFQSTGDFQIHKFYPLDTGPLASTDFPNETNDGLSLYLPDDPEKLKLIKVRFVRVEEEKNSE